MQFPGWHGIRNPPIMAHRQSLKVEAPATFPPPTRHVKILHEWRQAQETQPWSGNKYPECSTVACSHSCVKMSGSPPGGREIWINLIKESLHFPGSLSHLPQLPSQWVEGRCEEEKNAQVNLIQPIQWSRRGLWMTSKPCTPEEEWADLTRGRGCRILFVSCHLWDTDLHRGH